MNLTSLTFQAGHLWIFKFTLAEVLFSNVIYCFKLKLCLHWWVHSSSSLLDVCCVLQKGLIFGTGENMSDGIAVDVNVYLQMWKLC